MTPLVSVVIPVHNPPFERLSSCLVSVLGQGETQLEIVVVDDGSNEITASFLDAIAEDFSEVVVIHQENAGASAARNCGVKAAHGDYVMFVDSDDELVEGAIDQGVDAIERSGSDIVYGLVKKVASELDRAKIYKTCEKGARYESVTVDELLKYHLVGRAKQGKQFGCSRGVVKIGPVARLLRRELAASVSFPEDVKVSEDTAWNVAILQKCKTAIVIKECWYLYWQLDKSSVHRYRKDCADEALAALMAMKSSLGKTGLKQYRNEYIARCVGEMNRVAKTYSRSDCPLSSSEKRVNLNKVYCGSIGGLGSRTIADYLKYPSVTAKQCLCKTGLSLPVFRMISRLKSIMGQS